MRQASAIRQILLGILGSVAVASLIGCQVPGGSYGTEPLQIRFAEAVKVSLQTSPSPDAKPYHSPDRTASANTIILASQTAH